MPLNAAFSSYLTRLITTHDSLGPGSYVDKSSCLRRVLAIFGSLPNCRNVASNYERQVAQGSLFDYPEAIRHRSAYQHWRQKMISGVTLPVDVNDASMTSIFSFLPSSTKMRTILLLNLTFRLGRISVSLLFFFRGLRLLISVLGGPATSFSDIEVSRESQDQGNNQGKFLFSIQPHLNGFVNLYAFPYICCVNIWMCAWALDRAVRFKVASNRRLGEILFVVCWPQWTVAGSETAAAGGGAQLKHTVVVRTVSNVLRNLITGKVRFAVSRIVAPCQDGRRRWNFRRV